MISLGKEVCFVSVKGKVFVLISGRGSHCSGDVASRTVASMQIVKGTGAAITIIERLEA